MKKKILITGGYGYIGAKLALKLRKKYQVILMEHPKAKKTKLFERQISNYKNRHHK